MCLPYELGKKRFSAADIRARFKASHVPIGPGPMTAAEVRANRGPIITQMVRNRRQQMLIGQKAISRFLVEYFHQKLHKICDRVEHLHKQRHGHGKGVKADIDGPESDGDTSVSFGANEAAWSMAIEEELGIRSSIDLVAGYTPIVQSIAAKSYQTTTIALGDPEDPAAAHRILLRAQKMASQVTSINDTTRNQLVRAIKDSVENGDTIAETVRIIRADIPEIAASRIPTIARTEIGRAIDEGVKQAVKDSPSVTYVDVVGCQAIEPNIPTFDGVPTCNIQGVPAERVDELEFHINHTGAIVPSGYVTDPDDQEVHQGVGDGPP